MQCNFTGSFLISVSVCSRYYLISVFFLLSYFVVLLWVHCALLYWPIELDSTGPADLLRSCSWSADHLMHTCYQSATQWIWWSDMWSKRSAHASRLDLDDINNANSALQHTAQENCVLFGKLDTFLCRLFLHLVCNFYLNICFCIVHLFLNLDLREVLSYEVRWSLISEWSFWHS